MSLGSINETNPQYPTGYVPRIQPKQPDIEHEIVFGTGAPLRIQQIIDTPNLMETINDINKSRKESSERPLLSAIDPTYEYIDLTDARDAHTNMKNIESTPKKHSHYYKSVSKLEYVDVYRILSLYNVTDPCLQHAIKKLLVAGGRGAGKDINRDIQEAIDTLDRWQEIQQENDK